MIKFKYSARRDREFPIIPITLIKENVEIDTDALRPLHNLPKIVKKDLILGVKENPSGF